MEFLIVNWEGSEHSQNFFYTGLDRGIAWLSPNNFYVILLLHAPRFTQVKMELKSLIKSNVTDISRENCSILK